MRATFYVQLLAAETANSPLPRPLLCRRPVKRTSDSQNLANFVPDLNGGGKRPHQLWSQLGSWRAGRQSDLSRVLRQLRERLGKPTPVS